MSTIVTRAGKGSPLTNTEVDANFTNLNTDKVEKTSADITGGTINGTSIGASTASTGAFTSLTATSGVIAANSTTNALRITQTGTGNALLVEDAANPDSTPFVVDANGRVLSGLSTPIATLFGNTPGVQINAQFGVQAMSVSRFSANQFGADVDFVKSRNATVGSQTVLVSGDQISNLNFAGSDGTQFINAASIAVNVDGTPSTNDMPGRLVFSTTADGASIPSERMRIDNAGRVGIGVTPTAGRNFTVSTNITGATISQASRVDGQIQSDVTSEARGYSSNIGVANTAFTLGSLRHFYAGTGTIGASAIVTNQIGFFVESTLTGATNNYGFYSNIASGTGRWNFYAAGTAANYFAGDVTIGGALNVANPVVQQTDIGSAPNEIPLNQYLGEMAYMNAESVVIQPQASAAPSGIGDMVFQLTNDTTLVIKVKGSDGTVRSTTLTLA